AARLLPPLWKLALLALAMGVFFYRMVTAYPFRERFEFDTDEGITAMTAQLTAHGYRLYDEVWSDQPPLFRLMLGLVFRFLGADEVTAWCTPWASAGYTFCAVSPRRMSRGRR
ncbi:MAG: hypothetical protein L0Z70_13795, partial [Chloroflexi bacterium]|nr:hypothetical protein [Chloroflexota bacterium]